MAAVFVDLGFSMLFLVTAIKYFSETLRGLNTSDEVSTADLFKDFGFDWIPPVPVVFVRSMPEASLKGFTSTSLPKACC